ncbi:MAG: transposase [Bdellovibrionales bacterium]|nr:transposase [Ramlibacter sp.]
MTARSSYAKQNAKAKNAAIAVMTAALPKISNEVKDHFVTGPMLTGEAVSAATMAFKKAMVEQAMGGELAHHLGYASGAAESAAGANQRNGKSAKTVIRGGGPMRMEISWDRDGSLSSSTSGATRALTTRSTPCTAGHKHARNGCANWNWRTASSSGCFPRRTWTSTRSKASLAQSASPTSQARSDWMPGV